PLTGIDPATGAAVRTWTGRPERAAAIRAAVIPPAAAATAGTSTGTGTTGLATVLPAIRRVTCSDPNPYWDVRNYPPLVCFADAGDISVAIYSVYEVDSGNNTGSFTWCYNRCYVQSMSRWTSV